jgi:glutathione synthase/RimK-type ligase-like ATP-grasp enzyme
MNLSRRDCCILNGGTGSWAFEPLALRLASCIGIDVSPQPRRFNYLLHADDHDRAVRCDVFIPGESVRMASDKRLLAAAFVKHRVPIPQTHLIETFDEAKRFIRRHPGSAWCLKFPTSCGANGHRMITASDTEPANWPRPFVVQEFVRIENPEVYRTFCAAGGLFGWIARRFPEGSRASPWVAHARGARYVNLGAAPAAALVAARSALVVTGLLDSFGCVDLIRKPGGDWLVLEVGTDGLFNHVDRDLGDPALEDELHRRIADSFWKAAAKR